MDNGEDQALARRLAAAGAAEADPCALGFPPFYVYVWGGPWHLSGLGPDGYGRLGRRTADKTSLVLDTPPGINLRNPRILPGIHPRVF